MQHLIIMENDGIFPSDALDGILGTNQPPSDPETLARLRDAMMANYAHMVHQDADHEDYPHFRFQYQ